MRQRSGNTRLFMKYNNYLYACAYAKGGKDNNCFLRSQKAVRKNFVDTVLLTDNMVNNVPNGLGNFQLSKTINFSMLHIF